MITALDPRRRRFPKCRIRAFSTRCTLGLVVCIALGLPAPAQRPPAQLDGAVILHRLKALETVGSVLYVAAHPDDENTRLISWLANGLLVRTGYLSLTRGDGGQNLIGPELGEALGVLRTQELLEARRIDGGEQFFTRAVDFGYSKSPEESLAKWGRDAILADVVRVYRTFRPDVVITRFDRDGSGGHGHHTASSLLAREAIELAADAQAFPEQGLLPWRVKKLYFNGSTWWRKDLAEIAAKDPEHWIGVDVGGFDPLLGLSYTEIAAKSRSLHKSQGFGTAETRGETIEYLRLDVGTGTPLFEGIDTTWARVPDSAAVQKAIRTAIDLYDPRAPEASLELLAATTRALRRIRSPETTSDVAHMDDGVLLALRKARDAEALMLQAAGIVVEAIADTPAGSVLDEPKITLSALLRRDGCEVDVASMSTFAAGACLVPAPDGIRSQLLQPNRATTATQALQLQGACSIDEPFWLALPRLGDLHGTVGDYTGIEPASHGTLRFRSDVTFATSEMEHATRVGDLMYRWVDRVAGERLRPFTVTPPASLRIVDPVVLVRGPKARVSIEIEALASAVSGELALTLPAGWSLAAQPPVVARIARGERKIVDVELAREGDARGGSVQVALGRSSRTLHVIDYPHILPQAWYSPAAAVLVPLDVEVDVSRVGYIDGAGDDVAAALRRLGIVVERIDPASATSVELDRCDAIVTGIRAYNTQRGLARFQEHLLAYVERGGTLVLQYATNGSDLVMPAREIGPHAFVISRDRVTIEDAPPTFLVPDHPLMTTPNRIGLADFHGWVQERGLYFASELDPRYAALLSWNDPGEKPAQGALVACDHGRGRFIYTGLSLFRQLPAGVPGAYRLLANLVSRRTRRS